MSREPDTQDDPFARMAAALREEQPALRPGRRRSQPSFSELAPVIPANRTGAASVPPPAVKATPKKKSRVARSEPLPSIAIAGETRPQQATESGPALPSVMVSRPMASPTVRRQIAAPTMRHARGPLLTMTTRRKSAVLLFLAFSLSVFALGLAAFVYSRTTRPAAPAARVNAAEQPPPTTVDTRLSANLIAKPPQH